MVRKASVAQQSKEVRKPALGFVGAGNMATALIKGFLATGLYHPDQILASDVDKGKLEALRRRYAIRTTSDNAELLRKVKTVVIAVKPQIIDTVLAELCPAATSRPLFVSIAAGVTTARLEAALGGQVRVLRVMPNTPSLLGKGMSVVARGRFATDADERLGLKLLRTVGDAVPVHDERTMDAVTGLSGSGPAYVYLFAEGLIAGGIASGLPGPLATRLAYQTLTGSAAMLQQTGQTPGALRAMVTSPGGTTAAGLAELERRGFKEAIAAAVAAATRRSQELGRAK